MDGSRIHTGRVKARSFLLLSALCGCSPLPTALEEHPLLPVTLSLDTLDIEVQALWVRISAVPAVPEDLVLNWELEATTANPFWRPAVFRKHGRRSFQSPDTARVWGNVARAYDFTLAVAGVTASGAVVADTLVVRAPRCPDPARPTLLCNPRPAVGIAANRRRTDGDG